ADPAFQAQHRGADQADRDPDAPGRLHVEEVHPRRVRAEGVLRRVADRHPGRRDLPQPRAFLRPDEPVLSHHQRRRPQSERVERGAWKVDRVPIRSQDVHLHGRRGGPGYGVSGSAAGGDAPGSADSQAGAGRKGADPQGAGGGEGSRMTRLRLSVPLLIAAAATLGAQAPAASAPTPLLTAPAVIAPVPESPGQALIEQDESAMSGRSYSYDPAGRRDPFRSLLVREQSRGGLQRPPGIAGISIDDLVVHGIWKTRAGYVAQIRATDNKSYLVRA